MLLLTGCDPYPGEYVHYIHDFEPSDMDCHSFYHYTSVDNKLRQSGLQRYDLLTETDQDIFLSSTPDKEEVTSYWGDDNEVYFVVTTYQKGDDDLVLYYYDLKSDVCDKILENNKYLLVFRNSNTNRTIVKTDSQRYYIDDGILHEIEESDIIKSDFSSKEDVVRRVNAAETDIYDKLHKSPYRNYLNKERPKEHPVVYMMCIDKTEKIERLVQEIEESDVYSELKILSYSSDDYKGYSYIKIYNKNASVQNMADYLKTMTSASQIVTMSDKRRNRADFIFSDCNTMVRKLHYMFNWSPRRSSANNINLLHHASDV